MKIFEVTLDEGVIDHLKVLGRMAGREVKSALTGIDSGTLAQKMQTPVAGVDKQLAAAGMSANAIKRMGDQLFGQYQQSMISLMSREPTPGVTDAYGVTDPSRVPQTKRAKMLDIMINNTLSGLTQRRITNIDQAKNFATKISGTTTPGEDDPGMAMGRSIDKLSAAMSSIISDPDRVTAPMFASIAQSASEIASQSIFNDESPERVKFDERTGKFTIDGRPYDDANPQHRALMQAYNAERGR